MHCWRRILRVSQQVVRQLTLHGVRALVVMLLAACTQQAMAEESNPFVGTWELVSVTAVAVDGSVDTAPFGPNPSGYLTYTADGYMQVLLSFADRPLLHGNWRTAPEQERAAAFATVLGYAGTYSVADRAVIHHVTVSTEPNRAGTDIRRVVEFHGDSLSLTTPPTDLGDTAKRYRLTWRRAPTGRGPATDPPQ